VLSKQIVQAAEPGSTIVLENLKDIRKRLKAKRRSKTMRNQPIVSTSDSFGREEQAARFMNIKKIIG